MPTGPFRSNEERLVDEALASAYEAPAEALRTLQRRPLLLPRFGWMKRVPTIQDVLGINRAPMPPYNTNYTGGVGEINGSARNTGPEWI